MELTGLFIIDYPVNLLLGIIIYGWMVVPGIVILLSLPAIIIGKATITARSLFTYLLFMPTFTILLSEVTCFGRAGNLFWNTILAMTTMVVTLYLRAFIPRFQSSKPRMPLWAYVVGIVLQIVFQLSTPCSPE